MTGQRFIWNAQTVAALAAAIDEARDKGEAQCQVRFERRHTTTLWLADAMDMLHEAQAELAAHPPRVYPENREGEEP